jgi:phage terminase Nu1 subunit (DNA packaging protein)
MPAPVVTTGQLALLFGVSVRHVLRLTASGVLARRTEDGEVIKGRYDLLPAIRAYCGYLRQAARLDHAGESAFRRERNKKMEAEAEVAELKLKLYKRKLHRTEDVEFVMTTMLTALKSRLLAIPSRTTRQLIGKTNSQEIHGLLFGEIESALRELSEYDPNAFLQ